MTRIYPHHLLCLAIAMLLGACASKPPELTQPEGHVPTFTEFLFEAQPIPMTLTQAIVLDDRLADGTALSTLANTDTFTLPTVDFYGAPFTHINITAPEPIDDLWLFAESLSESDWAGATDDSPWRITITGATTARSVFFQQEVGLDSFLELYQTVKALGGPKKIKEVISALPGVELIRDTSGVIWDTSTSKPIDPALLAHAKVQYEEIVEANATNEGVEGILEPVGGFSAQGTLVWSEASDEEAWAEIFKSPIARRAREFVVGGNLDTRAFLRQLVLEPTWRPPDDGGAIRGAMQDTPGYSRFRTSPSGYDQTPFYFGRPGTQYWQYYSCATGASVTVEPIGCGPASFAGLLAFHFEYRNRTILNRSYDTRPAHQQSSINGMLYALTQSFGGKPRVTDYLGTCWLNTGGATAANAYAGGITRFVRDHAPGMQTTYSWSRLAGNKINSGDKLDILKWAMWRSPAGWPTSRSSEVPVVAEYFPGIEGHYSAIRQWRASGGPGWTLLVETENHPGVWSSISSNWIPETGVYAIY